MASRARLMARAGAALSVLGLLVLLLAALYLAADAEGLGRGLAAYYPYVFAAAALALGVLAIAIGRRLLALRRALREGLPGARLSRRLLVTLFALALPPLLLVFLFASRFIVVTVDSWMRANSAAALQDALALGRVYLDDRRTAAAASLRALADRLQQLDRPEWEAAAERELDAGLLRQVAIYDGSGRLELLAAADPDWIGSEPPSEDMLLVVRGSSRYNEVEPWQDGLRIRTLQRFEASGRSLLLQGLSVLPAEYAQGLIRVEQGVADVREALFLRDSLKFAFVLILGFVLLLSVLLAILVAFDLSRRLVAPIGRLASATRTVAEGQYDQPLPEVHNDELGFLVRSFNRMLRELELASARARSSQAETERQRAFLETVLSRLSSAVLVLDEHGCLRSANAAAAAVLGADSRRWIGQALAEWRRTHPASKPLVDLLLAKLREDAREFREEVVIDGDDGRQLWLLRGARLPEGGLVAVLDDTTAIDRARRDAAWGEVARRLAHEVKNPLTPIQLSAERLRRRVLPTLSGAEAEVLDRATHTIVAQVDALKTLVNAFGDYARVPTLQRRPLALAALVDEIIELYAGDPLLQIGSRVAADLPAIEADAGRLRQVLHNLIKNAQEAVPAGQPVRIEIGARAVHGGGRAEVELWVEDAGPGLPDGFDASWFEPYRTTKAKGTGLGLAIVRKIAEEHGGSLTAGPRVGGGARFSLRLPA